MSVWLQLPPITVTHSCQGPLAATSRVAPWGWGSQPHGAGDTGRDPAWGHSHGPLDAPTPLSQGVCPKPCSLVVFAHSWGGTCVPVGAAAPLPVSLHQGTGRKHRGLHYVCSHLILARSEFSALGKPRCL